MSSPIEKELLLARLKYLSDVKSRIDDDSLNSKIIEVIKDMINNGEIKSNMVVESVYNHLVDSTDYDLPSIKDKARDIISFIN